MFLGTHTPKLDEKGRLILPAKFRDELAEGLVITRGQDRCLAIWPIATFVEQTETLRSSPSSSKQVRDYQLRQALHEWQQPRVHAVARRIAASAGCQLAAPRGANTRRRRRGGCRLRFLGVDGSRAHLESAVLSRKTKLRLCPSQRSATPRLRRAPWRGACPVEPTLHQVRFHSQN
jgi:hypothetical protein